MSYEFYKVLHLGSLACLVLGCGLLLGAFAVNPDYKGPIRKWGFVMHGIGVALLLITGFGLLAKLGIMAAIPGWAIAKMGIWLCMGAMLTLIKRKPEWRNGMILAILILVSTAATLAITKPF